MTIITANWTGWVASDAWRAGALPVLPVPPRAVHEAMWLVAEADVDTRRLIELVQKDPVIAIRVLRMANAAAFAPSGEVTTVERAVVRLGARSVRNTVLAACFTSWIRRENVYGRRANDQVQHAIGAACVARRLAAGTGGNPDESFVHGLLHDIGKLFILRLRSEFVRLGGRRPTAAEVEESIATHHAEMGGIVLAQWGMPPTVQEPVRWHHEPLRAEGTEAASVVYVADRLCHRYGFGCPPEDEADGVLNDPICMAIGLDEDRLAELDREALGLLLGGQQMVG